MIDWKRPEEITEADCEKPLLVVAGEFGQIPHIIIASCAIVGEREKRYPIWWHNRVFLEQFEMDQGRPMYIGETIIAWAALQPPEWINETWIEREREMRSK